MKINSNSKNMNEKFQEWKISQGEIFSQKSFKDTVASFLAEAYIPFSLQATSFCIFLDAFINKK